MSEDKKLEDNHGYVCDAIQSALKDCSEQGIKPSLVLHASLTVILDYVLDAAPDKQEVLGLIGSCMSAAYAHNTGQDDISEDEDENEGTLH